MPTSKFVAVAKLPAPLPNNMETFEGLPGEPWFATAKSALPSRLKSPTATAYGALAAPKFVAGPKLGELHPPGSGVGAGIGVGVGVGGGSPLLPLPAHPLPRFA